LSQEEILSDCIFCKIVAGEIPSDRVGENEGAIAFRDINPEANVHILVVPKTHSKNVIELSEDPESMQSVLELMRQVSAEQTNGHFKFLFNTGEDAGQTVFHAHGHILSQGAS
jgi:histidine triad (HIT) family protein